MEFHQKDHSIILLQSLPANAVRTKKWSIQDCLLFLMLHESYSNQWLLISKLMKTKTENDVKNHFYMLLRKFIAKVQTLNFVFEGHLEIIQCYYICNYILSYFMKTHYSKKEYLNTLITLRKLKHEQCSSYFLQLSLIYAYISKAGWKKYAMENYNVSELSITGYRFPNRVIPNIKKANCTSLSIEDKTAFKAQWMDTIKRELTIQQKWLF